MTPRPLLHTLALMMMILGLALGSLEATLWQSGNRKPVIFRILSGPLGAQKNVSDPSAPHTSKFLLLHAAAGFFELILCCFAQ